MLDNGADAGNETTVARDALAGNLALRHIALITDGSGLGAPLDYVMDDSLKQGAKIDLLLHGNIESEKISVLEKTIEQNGLDIQRIELGLNAVDGIVEYIRNQPSLIFMVSMPDDDAARILMEEVIPKRRDRISVPLVLIGDRPESQLAEKSAARH